MIDNESLMAAESRVKTCLSWSMRVAIATLLEQNAEKKLKDIEIVQVMEGTDIKFVVRWREKDF